MIRQTFLSSIIALFLFCAPVFPWSHGASAAALDGPPARFERSGDTVCASYSIDGTFELYKKRIFSQANNAALAISGLPPATPKAGAPEDEAIVHASFKACAKAPSAKDTVTWIDQSCLASQGLCLPPRGYEIDSKGQARQLDPSVVAPQFGALMGTAGSQKNDGWGNLSFGVKKP